MKEGLYFVEDEAGRGSYVFEITGSYWDCYSHPAKLHKILMVKGHNSLGEPFHTEAFGVWDLLKSAKYVGKVL